MNFVYPRILWLLLLVTPLLVVFLWWSWQQRMRLSAAFIQSRLLANLTVGVSRPLQKLRLVLLTVSVPLLLLVLARPQWGFGWEEARQRGRDIIVAIDTSRSMLAADIPPNRLTRAKLAALELARTARTDRLGLVAFAGTAFLQAPLTLDDEAFRQSVNILEAGIIPEGGSSIADAIETALASFKDETENHRILVLFSDGEEHEPAALDAAKKAAQKGMRIFTIGVGTPNGELIRVRDEKGVSGFIKDDQGNAVKSSLNEKLLQEIATVSEGFYLPLQGAKTMEMLYQRGLAPLTPTDSGTQLVKQFKERFQWPLAFAILLLAAELFVPERSRKAAKAVVEEKRGLREAVALIFCILAVSSSHASPSRALQDYKKGNYKEAQQEFERLLGKKPDDPRLHYNAGAAAYQNHDYEKASKEFESALISPDLKLQQMAYYNLGNSQYKSGETEQDFNKKLESWETAARHFDSAYKLNTKDEDARYNRDLVRKKIEEIKKQQQPQDKDKKDQKNDKDDKDKDKDKDKKDDKKSEQDKKDQKGDQKDQDKKDQEKKQDQKDQDKQKSEQQKKQEDEQKKQEREQQQADKKGDKDKDKEKKDAASKNDEPSPEQEGEPSPVQLGKMSAEQARQLLETAKSEEKALLFLPQTTKDKPRGRVIKDW